MRFLADENIAPTIVSALRNAGHDVIDVKEKKWFAKPDHELILYAEQEKCIVITCDKDFMFQYKVPAILLRFFNQEPKKVSHYLLSFLKKPSLVHKMQKPVVVVLTEFVAEFHYQPKKQ